MKLFNEDSLEVMEEMIKDGVKFECIATDPPYKITSRGSAKGMGGYMANDERALKGKIFDHNDIKFENYLPLFNELITETGHIYIMCNNINLQELLVQAEKAGLHFIKSLIWQKPNKICGRWYMGEFEYICMFRKKGGVAKPINNAGSSDIIKVAFKKLKDENKKNLHDTEKPVELMEYLIGNSTKEHEMVLDPFAGIGSTGIACKNLKRTFVGCEIDKKYFDIAQERIKERNGIK